MCDVRLNTFTNNSKIVQDFISLMSLGCLFGLSDQLYFWKVKVEDSCSKPDSMFQRIRSWSAKLHFVYMF